MNYICNVFQEFSKENAYELWSFNHLSKLSKDIKPSFITNYQSNLKRKIQQKHLIETITH